jgi:SAM-dependent methyltransferase
VGNLEDIQAYYQDILPFYEKESIRRAHLSFWRGLARRWRPRQILEVGVGLGRITGALGHRIPAVGIDISLPMLWRASRRFTSRSQARFLAADMRHLPFGSRFDLIIAPGDPFCHLTATSDRRRALKEVANRLSERGHFVLEGLYRPREISKPLKRQIRLGGGVLSIAETWRPLGVRHLWRARYCYRERLRKGPDRALDASFVARSWNPQRIRSFFASCGLAVEELWGDFDRRPFAATASRLVAVARSRARFVHWEETDRERSS